MDSARVVLREYGIWDELTPFRDRRQGLARWALTAAQPSHGPIPDRYPLKELPGADYPERTRRNVEDSGATLILHRGPLSAGTLLTLQICEELLKPVCLIDAAEVTAEEGAGIARDFIDAHDIHRLNVAGPRASHWAQAHDYARKVIRALLAISLHENDDAMASSR